MTNCWEWEGNLWPAGYGRPRRDVLAHRVSYEAFIEKIPEGKEIHHVCGNRKCVNPWHLMVVTRSEHRYEYSALAPTREDGIPYKKMVPRKTCGNGHIRNEKNTRVYERNGNIMRICRVCDRDSKRMHYRRKKNSLGSKIQEVVGLNSAN